jgi:hypothetical protein
MSEGRGAIMSRRKQRGTPRNDNYDMNFYRGIYDSLIPIAASYISLFHMYFSREIGSTF